MGVAIVAIPYQEDPVWKYSSEKVPHMTLIYLGDPPESDLGPIEQFVSHIVQSGTLHRFDMKVVRRGTLGPDNADVLFFKDENPLKPSPIYSAINSMLEEPHIRKAYEATDQFPQWTPHLTMGYPTSPAKPDNRDFTGFSYVGFDRIALWLGNYEGPEFYLSDDRGMEVRMSDIYSNVVLDTSSLSHHGVKGMKWGVRKDQISKSIAERQGTEVVVKTKPGQQIQTVGGNNRQASADAIRARTAQQVATKSTLDALSNKELQDLVTRMNLEQQYNRLRLEEGDSRLPAGQKFAKDLIDQNGDTAVKALAANPSTAAIAAPLGVALTGYKFVNSRNRAKLENAPGARKNKNNN